MNARAEARKEMAAALRCTWADDEKSLAEAIVHTMYAMRHLAAADTTGRAQQAAHEFIAGQLAEGEDKAFQGGP